MTFTGKWRDPDAAIAEAVRLFNCGEYFETHEVLEEAWREAGEPLKTFLKGLIHAAVALYQYSRKNRVGAVSKYHSTHYYLGPFSPYFGGVDVAALLTQMDEYFSSMVETRGSTWRLPEEPRPEITLV